MQHANGAEVVHDDGDERVPVHAVQSHCHIMQQFLTVQHADGVEVVHAGRNVQQAAVDGHLRTGHKGAISEESTSAVHSHALAPCFQI